jgi:2-methylcitrate dehydratase PrpD
MDKIYALADHIVNTDFDKLPEDVVKKTKLFILDSLGVAIAAADGAGIKEVLDLLKEQGGKEESTVYSYGGKLNALDATLVNSMIVHSLDLDDLHEGVIVHPSSTQIPVAFAVAEQLPEKVSGKDLITAIVLGGDVSCRVAAGITDGIGFIRSGICGIFGAVANAAKLRGCDRDQIVHAMGIAFSQTAGNAQVLQDGALVKRMQPGFAGRDGIMSVYLAEKGITGSTRVMEGKFGFLELYKRGEIDADNIVKDLGKVYEMSNVSVKPYIGGRYIHGPAELGIALAKEHNITPDQVAEMNVYLPQTAYTYVGAPFDLNRGNIQVMVQFNATYGAAAGFVRGDLFIGELDEDVIRDPVINELIPKVKLYVDESVKVPMATTPVTLEIKTKSGETYKKSVQDLKGHPNNFLTEEEFIEKFRKCVKFSNNKPSDENVEKIIDLVMSLENLSDVSAIPELLVKEQRC